MLDGNYIPYLDNIIKTDLVDWGTTTNQIYAARIPILDFANHFTATNIEDVLAEIQTNVDLTNTSYVRRDGSLSMTGDFNLDGHGINTGTVIVTAEELSQIANLDGLDIENADWGIVSRLNQDLTTTSDVVFNSLTLTTPLADASVASDITLDNITQITARDHGDLTNIGTGADHSYINQDVTTSASPTFAGLTLNGPLNGITTTSLNYLMNLDQSLSTTSDVVFNSLTLTTPLADASVASDITLDNITQITARNHSDLQNIDGDTFHILEATRTALQDGNAQLTALQTDGSPSFVNITATGGNLNLTGSLFNLYSDGSNWLSMRSAAGISILIDSNNNTSTALFEIRKDITTPGTGGTQLFSINETGDMVLLGDATINGDKITFGNGAIIDNESDAYLKLEDTFINLKGQWFRSDADIYINNYSDLTDRTVYISNSHAIYKANLDVENDGIFHGNVSIMGSLNVVGSVTTTTIEDVLVEDVTITLNYGYTGSGVPGNLSGLIIGRGTSTTAGILWDDSMSGGTLKIGLEGSYQPVATREESANMFDTGIAIWDGGNYRFTTTSDLTWDGTNLKLSDNKNLVLGTGSDFYLYHNESNSFINNNTGNLYIQTGSHVLFDSSGSFYIRDADDSSAELFLLNTGARTLVIFNEDDEGPTYLYGGVYPLYFRRNTTTVGARINQEFQMKNSVDAYHTYARIAAEIDVNTDGSEEGTLRLQSSGSGAITDGLVITSTSTFSYNDIYVYKTDPHFILRDTAHDKDDIDYDFNGYLNWQDSAGTSVAKIGFDSATDNIFRIINDSSAYGGGNLNFEGWNITHFTGKITNQISVSDTFISVGNSTTNTYKAGIQFMENSATADLGSASTFGFRMYYDGASNQFHLQSGNEATLTDRIVIERDSGNITVGALTATSYGGIPEANLVDKTANETITGTWTFNNNIIISGAQTIKSSVDTSGYYISGGTSSTSGGNIRLYGASHATVANQITFYGSSSRYGYFNSSGNFILDNSLSFASGATVNVINTTFVDNDTSLMTSQAIKEKIEDYGYSTSTGTVTSVAAGSGLDFTTITGSGSVTLGTPSTLTSATTNGVTSTSHTHAITTGIANTNILRVDHTSPADNDYAKFTANGLEGRSYTEVKSDLSLSNVENTALSTWAGTTNITTLGTITSGTWSATDIAVSAGGTGKSSWTQYAIPYLSATTTFGQVAIGTAGQVLTVNGSANGYTWSTPLINPMTAVGDIIIGSTSGAATRLPVGTSGQLLRSDGTDPEWFTPSYLTGNQTITLSGDVTGSGTTSITCAVANDSHTHDTRYYTETEVDNIVDDYLPLAGGILTGDITLTNGISLKDDSYPTNNYLTLDDNGGFGQYQVTLASASSLNLVCDSNNNDATSAIGMYTDVSTLIGKFDINGLIMSKDISLGDDTTLGPILKLYGTTASKHSEIKCTNGNLHIDAEDTYAIYLNYYSGTDGIVIGNGSTGTSGTKFYANGNIDVGGSLTIPQYLYHSGDTDTYLKFDTNKITLRAGGYDSIVMDTTNGLYVGNTSYDNYYYASNTHEFFIGANSRIKIYDLAIYPTADHGSSLGRSTYAWNNLYRLNEYSTSPPLLRDHDVNVRELLENLDSDKNKITYTWDEEKGWNIKHVKTEDLPDWLTDKKEKEHSNNIRYLDVDSMMGVLIKHARDQYKKNDEQDKKIKELEDRIMKLEKMLSK